jgi:hypothetical protein
VLNFLLRRRIAAFEVGFDYNMDYAREILAADRGAFMKFGGVMGFSAWRRDVPAAAYFAAKIAATAAEDCGPCTQLMVTMAERAGVPAATLRAVLAGDERAMGDEAALGWRFARAVLAHDSAAEMSRRRIAELWGQRAVISLSFAVTAGRLFPTLKYALGHGVACVRVSVAGAPMKVARAA